jgi:hypothetical protein
LKLATRLLAIMVVFPATYYFIYWLPCSLLLSVSGDLHWSIATIISLFSAVAVSWYVWKKLGSANEGLISNILKGAIILGSIGFSIGFFGPIIFSPQANQGPLLGIFITGPLGFVLGGIAGAVYWTMRIKVKNN